MEKSRYRLKEVCLEITDTCPLNCAHCSGSCSLDSHDVLSLDRVKRIIDDMCKMDGEILEISGGEPLTHPYLLQIVEYAEGKGLETVLYTSGSMLDGNGRITPLNITMAEKLRQAGLKKVIFNLQGATSRTHETVTQVKGSFRNVTNAIKTVESLHFWVGVHFVPMEPNFEKLEEVIRLCSYLNVKEVGVLRFVPQGRGKVNRSWLELSKTEFEKFVQDLIRQFYQCNGLMTARARANYQGKTDKGKRKHEKHTLGQRVSQNLITQKAIKLFSRVNTSR